MIIVLIRETKYLNGNPEIPVYEETPNHYTAKEIVETLLDKTIPLTKITTTQPVSCQDNFTFVVDISKLDKPKDIRCDDLGSWECNGKRCSYCSVDDDGYVVSISTTKPVQDAYHIYALVRRYYRHTTAGDYKKTIAEIYGQHLSNCFVYYMIIHLSCRFCWGSA